MGQLKPNVAVTYETDNGITYAIQDNVNSKVVVGYTYDSRTDDGKPLVNPLQDVLLWNNIRRKALTHPGLQSELERVIVFYNLLVTNEKTNTIMWHPV